MEYSPPPFFKTGPTPFARLLIFSALSVIFLVADARFNYLQPLRQATAVVIYPLLRVAAIPADIVRGIGGFFGFLLTQASLLEDNTRLTRENFDHAALLLELKALRVENAHLRELLSARERLRGELIAAEVLYAARDPFSRKVMIDKGSQSNVQAGQIAVDNRGVVGQVTRVYPWVSEVTLITDKGQFVPVQNLRNGLRAILAGTGNDGSLELRFVPPNADFESGDELVTSGIDGVYPPGLPVARVTEVERSAEKMFARVVGVPAGGVVHHAHVLIVSGNRDQPSRPPADDSKSPRAKKSRKG